MPAGYLKAPGLIFFKIIALFEPPRMFCFTKTGLEPLMRSTFILSYKGLRGYCKICKITTTDATGGWWQDLSERLPVSPFS